MAKPLGVAFSPIGAEETEDELTQLLSRMVGAGKPNLRRLPRPRVRGAMTPDEIWELIMRGGGVERPDIPGVVSPEVPEVPGPSEEPIVEAPEEPFEPVPTPDEGEIEIPMPPAPTPAPVEPGPGGGEEEMEPLPDAGTPGTGGPFEDVPPDYEPAPEPDEPSGPFEDVPPDYEPEPEQGPGGPFEDLPGSESEPTGAEVEADDEIDWEKFINDIMQAM